MKLVLTLTLFVFANCYPTATFAREPRPTFDCAKAQNTVEELICTDLGLGLLDEDMGEHYFDAMSVARSMDAGADEAIATLRASQRGWIKGRDECWKAEDPRDCVANAYLIRTGELVTQWMLSKPRSVNSYFCDGNPANEITAMFYGTGLPSVRLEYGDAIATGHQVPTASGTKYEASFGRSIWTKGSEAIVVWPEGNEMSCVLVK